MLLLWLLVDLFHFVYCKPRYDESRGNCFSFTFLSFSKVIVDDNSVQL